MRPQHDRLTQINLDDLVASFGWMNHPLLARILRRLFLRAARNFAADMADFDTMVGTRGLSDASRAFLKKYARSLRVTGQNNLPASSFLALSNHPGMADTISLFAALNRPDLKIIALDRPFLNALPNIEKSLYYVKDSPAARMTLVRQVSSHLREGGAALTFPAGHIEPDPGIYPGAVESLNDWTNSAGIFLRMAPETPIVPVLVRGVVRKNSARHPLLKFKKTKGEREKLTAALQLLAHVVFHQSDVHVCVQIGHPIYAKGLDSTETQIIHQSVLAEMTRLIENPPQATDGGIPIFGN